MAGEWQKFRVDQLGSVVTGRTPPGTLPEYFGDAVPFVTPTDMDGRRIVRETARSLSVQGSEILKRVIVQRGVAVSCIGWQMGKAVLIDRPAATNQQINTLVPKPDLADDLFVYYALTSERDAIFRLGAGGSRTPILNKSGFEAFEISLPPLAEQKAIAAVLGALDDKIELNRRMNATLEAMARALFQSWFVDFDPVRAKLDGRKPAGLDDATVVLFPDHLEDSSLGHIPKGWKVGNIQDCCVQIQNGGTPRRNEPRFWGGGNIPWLASGEVRQSIIIATESFITEEGLAESSAKWVPAFSTVVALYGATAGQVSFTSSRLTTNQAVCALIPKKDFAFFNYLTMRGATAELENKAVGSAQQNISKGIVEETRVVLPPPLLIERFAEVASPLFERWISNLHQSRTLAALRDTLLPKLLSGEIRVAALGQANILSHTP